MSSQQNQYNNRTYEERQDHIYDTHKALQELVARIRTIRTSLIRSPSVLMYAHIYTTNTLQTDDFVITRRSLNNLIYQLINVNYDQAESL